GREPADENSSSLAAAGTVGRDVQSVGVGRIRENFLRSRSQQHVRITNVERNVPALRPLFTQGIDDLLGIVKCMREDQPAPAAIDAGFGLWRLHTCLTARLRVEALESMRLRPLITRHSTISHGSASTFREGQPAKVPILAAA